MNDQNYKKNIFVKFLKILKIPEFINKIRFFSFNVHEENMITIEIENGREAP